MAHQHVVAAGVSARGRVAHDLVLSTESLSEDIRHEGTMAKDITTPRARSGEYIWILQITNMSTVASTPFRRHYYKPCLAGTVVGTLTGLQMILVLPFNPVLALLLTVVGILLTAKLMRRWKCSVCNTGLRDRHDPVCSKCNAIFRAQS